MLRVIWKFEADVLEHAPHAAERLEETARATEGISLLTDPEPVFTPLAHRETLNLEEERLEEERTEVEQDLADFFHVFVEDPDSAERLRESLLARGNISFVRIEEPPALVEITATTGETLQLGDEPTPDLSHRQAHLEPGEQGGVNARFAWTLPGGNGDGVTVTDVEIGWNFAHEDLLRRSNGLLHGVPQNRDHGTAALGVIGADANDRGILGIANGAFTGGSSAGAPGGTWNPEQAILAAAAQLSPGDVLLFELQTGKLLPYEVSDSIFRIFKKVTERGIYVVEVAGNGGKNLDSVLPRSQERDSGAILVGAGGAAIGTSPRARLSDSNFGSRLDVQGWGEKVVTCGGRQSPGGHDLVDHPNPSRCYTRSFSQTSSAAAIVAGVVACIAGRVRAFQSQNGMSDVPLRPVDMRRLLMDTGRAQLAAPGFPSSERIGPLPDLKRALERLNMT